MTFFFENKDNDFYSFIICYYNGKHKNIHSSSQIINDLFILFGSTSRK